MSLFTNDIFCRNHKKNEAIERKEREKASTLSCSNDDDRSKVLKFRGRAFQNQLKTERQQTPVPIYPVRL